VQTPEPTYPPDRAIDPLAPRHGSRTPMPGYWGERLAWVAGLVLAVSAFTDWYSGGQTDGLVLSVTGWHTGALGKLVFFIGLATLILEALREAGIELPATVPESPRPDRVRLARDHLRADPPALDPGHVLRHRPPRHRDLHQPGGGDRTDHRRLLRAAEEL
jgi:hypothetical protein